MTDRPRRHVSAVRPTHYPQPVRVDPVELAAALLDACHHVFVVDPAPSRTRIAFALRPADRTTPGLGVAGAAPWVAEQNPETASDLELELVEEPVAVDVNGPPWTFRIVGYRLPFSAPTGAMAQHGTSVPSADRATNRTGSAISTLEAKSLVTLVNTRSLSWGMPGAGDSVGGELRHDQFGESGRCGHCRSEGLTGPVPSADPPFAARPTAAAYRHRRRRPSRRDGKFPSFSTRRGGDHPSTPGARAAE